MINTVEKFLDGHGLLDKNNTFLVGFSGGFDSLCLLDILVNFSHKYKFKVIALHLNHNWRKEESFQEEENCKLFCKQKNIECITETLEGSEQKTENIAREARYAFFLKYAKKYKNSYIFTGHTSSDNAETIIYRIIKGTGVNGLKGIPQERLLGETKVFRPLLSITRSQTEDYCLSMGLIPNTDSSNFDINYKRNFIRHKIMPLFKEINFHAEKSINSLANLAISQSNIVNEYIDIIKNDVYDGNRLITSKFRLLSDDVMKQIIYNAFLKYHFDYDLKKISNVLNFIKENFDSKAGLRYSISNNLWLFANSKHIYLIQKPGGDKTQAEIQITGEGKWTFEGGEIFSLEKYQTSEQLSSYPNENSYYAYVDMSLCGTDLTLRTRRDGDFISPFGMTGSMKLKKYLNSKGVSQHEKDGLILLCKASEVLWVAGVGLSNKLKVVNSPTHVLRLEKMHGGR